MQVPSPAEAELGPFVESSRSCPKTGLHNPLKNPERFLEMGHISNKAGRLLRDPAVAD